MKTFKLNMTREAFQDELLQLAQRLPKAKSDRLLRNLGVVVPEHGERDHAREYVQARAGAGETYDYWTMLLTVTGKHDVFAAQEEVKLWRAAHFALEELRPELAKADAILLDREIAKAKDQHRHTPDRELRVRNLLAEKHVTHEGALAMIGLWEVVPENQRSAAALTYKGRHYGEMSGAERAALKRAEPDVFNRLRDAWIAAGSPAR